MERLVACGRKGGEDERAGHSDERRKVQDRMTAPTGSGVLSASTTTTKSGGAGGKNTSRPQRRSTVSTTESDSSSDGGNRVGPAAQKTLDKPLHKVSTR